VQLHSKQVLEVKNGPGHALYEESRSIEAAAKGRDFTPAEGSRLQEISAESEKVYGEAFDKFTGGGG